MRNVGATKLEDEWCFFLGAVGDRYEAKNYLMIVEFSRVESIISVGNSGSGWCWKYIPRGFEVKGDQEIWEKSNAEVSETKSETLDSSLVLVKVSPNSSS